MTIEKFAIELSKCFGHTDVQCSYHGFITKRGKKISSQTAHFYMDTKTWGYTLIIEGVSIFISYQEFRRVANYGPLCEYGYDLYRDKFDEFLYKILRGNSDNVFI